jgi:hypothetical protein
MKKEYTKPTIAIFNVIITNIVAGSVAKIDNDDAKEDYISEDGNNDAREGDIFNNNHAIWDNAW